MNGNESNAVVCIDVTLDAGDSGVLFHYQAADEASRKYVDEKGNIDLRESTGCPSGPVDLWFRIQASELTLDGMPHQPGFSLDDSIWLGEATHGAPTGPYREPGVLARAGLRRPQFHGYCNPRSEIRELRLTNRNSDGKEYKYTLRVRATGPAGSRWLEDDPKIKNRGGNQV